MYVNVIASCSFLRSVLSFVLFIGCRQVNFVDPTRLEQSLCHVLMDKALTNCLLLLDKAEMEKELKRLLEPHPTTDSKGNCITALCFYVGTAK